MPLSPGARLGAYEIQAPLGAGGMGEVYRARDPRLNRDVALKILSQEVASDPTRLQRFTREAQAVAALNHPHIITIYSTEEADGVRFLTMELVEGKALDALIPPDGLPLARFLEIALSLADALTAAHQKQITHRDLKPANVMIAADGRVKVLDFGLARVGEPSRGDQTLDATRATLTHEGTIVGTVPYMSPEQIEGRSLDHRTDLFSLGVIFYEMATGVRPFQGDSSPLLMSSILKDAAPSARERRADVPEALARLIDRCLEKRPDDRVQTARDVYNELRHIGKQLDSGASNAPLRAQRPEAAGTWIAVLPFAAHAGDAEAQAIADGLTEDVPAGLSRFPYLSVVSSHSTRALKGASADVRRLGETLGARYILDGALRRAGSGLRIAARLVDAHTGAQLWSETYSRDLQALDALAIQDDVTDRLVATVADVHGVLLRSMSHGLHDRPINDLNASELALRYWAYQRQHSPAEHRQLRAAFEQLVGQRPNLAAAWSALAHLYGHEHAHGFNEQPDCLGRTHRALTRALELDPVDQHGWEALATTYFFEHDREGFVHAADRAIALNPRNANAMALIGSLYAHAGDFDRGCTLTERAMALNPDHPGWYYFAFWVRDYYRGHFADALQAAKRINMPQHLWSHLTVACAAGQLGRQAEAAAAVEAFYAVAPEMADEQLLMGAARRWEWVQDGVERQMDGFHKALALRDTAGRDTSGQPRQT